MVLRWFILSTSILQCLQINAQTFQDCNNPFPICALHTYHFEEMEGHGLIQDPLPESTCTSILRLKETNSKWLYLEIEDSGTLMFNIQANRNGDNVDFILYEIYEDCADMSEVGCNVSGKKFIKERSLASNQLGTIGINYTSLCDFEKSGCKYDDNDFLKFLSVKGGENYILLVNNNDSKNGFSISFDGNCKLRKSNNCPANTQDLNITKVQPSPEENRVYAQINSIASDCSIQILDAKGKILSKKRERCSIGLQKVEIEMTNLSSGMYILKVVQSGKNAAKSFIKKD